MGMATTFTIWYSFSCYSFHIPFWYPLQLVSNYLRISDTSNVIVYSFISGVGHFLDFKIYAF